MQKTNAEPGPSTFRADPTRHAWTHFVVRDGSPKRVIDYDDGWQMPLAFHSKAVPDAGANVGQFTPHLLFWQPVTRVVIMNRFLKNSKFQFAHEHTVAGLFSFGLSALSF